MNIALIACAWPPNGGGIGNSAFRFSQSLSKQYKVTVFTPSHLKPWLQRGHGAFLPQLLWRLKNFDYLFLHYPFFGTAEIVWLFKLFNPQKKLIIHYHMDVRHSGFIGRVLAMPSRLIFSALLEQAEIITISSLDYARNGQLRKYFSTHGDKFREIAFGLDTDKFHPRLIDRESENKIDAQATAIVRFVNDKFIKRNRVDLLFVGGLDKAHYFKGVDILLSALAGLDRKFNWRLKIVGSGERQADYEELGRTLNLSQRLEFTGRIPDEDLIRAYQAADILILPSINTNEAFGLVIIEAMACGTAVIASDLPGVRSVFTDGQQGVFARPGDSHDLREKIEYLLVHVDLRNNMKKAARQLALEKYNDEACADKLRAIFQ